MTLRFDLLTAPLDRGTVLLEASAGTGKTYTLVGLLLRLLLEREIDSIDQALVVTFTVAATEELKNRVRAALLRALRATATGDDDAFFAKMAAQPDAERILRGALDDFDRVSIATIHGFCKRLLDEGAFESREPFALDFVADPLPYLHNAAADALRSCYTPEASVPGALLHLGRRQPKELVHLYGLWQRYPEVRLEPVDADPERHYRAVLEACIAAAAALDDEAREIIENLDWYAGKSLGPAASRYSTERLRTRAAAEPLLALPEFFTLAPAQFDKYLKQKRRPSAQQPFFAACDAVYAATTTAQSHLQADLLRRMHARLDADKRKDHVLDFQDLLQRTHAALHDPERRQALLAAVGSRYRTALIDEFQDTDRLQYDIFATCFGSRPLFLIGDPKQSIYGFRGADLRAYADARADASDAWTLGTNWRSNAGLVAAVQHACSLPGAFVDDTIAPASVTAKATPEALRLAGEDTPPLQWRYVDIEGHDHRNGWLYKGETEARVAADVTAEIARLLRAAIAVDGRPLQPRDIAVLCRTNAQSTLVQDHLREAAIVSAIGKAGDVFATEELIELDRLLIAALRPRNLQGCRAAMATRLYGFDASALAALDEDSEAFDTELQRFERWRRTWVRRGFFAMKEQMLAELSVEARLLQQRGGERRLTNVQQLCELLHRAEHDNRLSPEGLHEWLQHERLHSEEIDYKLRELRLESDDDAVQILTVHGSKGLEYEVVFCPFLWDAREVRGDAVVATDAGRELMFGVYNSHPHKPAAELERIAEDVRLAYVGLTRARRRCYVHIGPIGQANASALCWLLDPVPAAARTDDAGKRPGEWFLEWTKRMRARPERIAELLDRMIAGSDGTMTRVDVAATPSAEPVPATAPAGRGKARRARRQPRARGLFSFSSLIADAGHEPTGRDTADPAAATAPAAPPTGIFAFARGPAAGNCLHAILEHLDWSTVMADSLADHVRRTLEECGLSGAAAHLGDVDPTAIVVRNVRELAAALAGPEGPTFGALCAGPGVPEWQFTLPTSDSSLEVLTASFRAHGGAVARRYADRLAELPPRVLRGFLTGFVDHVAAASGRHWIIDWKSNHLGDTTGDYGPEAIAAAMHGHDYVLQYHLYVLALHRQLRARLPDYDYDRDFGGVSYAFLRGAVPGSDNGMFYDRPPRALVEAMDAWATGAQPEGVS